MEVTGTDIRYGDHFSIPKSEVIGEPELYTCDVCGYCVHVYPLRPLSQLTPEWFALKGICYDCFFNKAVKSMKRNVTNG